MAKHVWRSHGVVGIAKRSGTRVVSIGHMNPKAVAVQMPFFGTPAAASSRVGLAARCLRVLKSAAAAIRRILTK
jgi:hypothetical protein